MTIYEVISSPETASDTAQSQSPGVHDPLGFWPRRYWTLLTTWLATCADYHEAATLYEEFRGLSDAELARRGLDRATLGRDVCQACDRSADRPPK